MIGLVLTVGAAGGLAGSMLCGRLPVVHHRPEWTLVVCVAATAVPLLVVAARPAPGLLLAMFALAGLLAGPTSVAVFTTRDREAPACVPRSSPWARDSR